VLRTIRVLPERWREALSTRENGQGKRHAVERIMRSVRSFHTDLHSWAVEGLPRTLTAGHRSVPGDGPGGIAGELYEDHGAEVA
jgi:hypothetical protein